MSFVKSVSKRAASAVVASRSFIPLISLSFVFPAELPHLLVEFIVDMLAEPFFAAGFHRAVRREPLHAAVLSVMMAKGVTSEPVPEEVGMATK